jgi:pimeloyl-ACP methyl ester carboxylesterase
MRHRDYESSGDGLERGFRLTIVPLLIVAFSSGCVSINTELARKTAYLAQLGAGSAVKVRKTPRNPLEDQLNLFARKGPSPSPRTAQVLRRYGLDELFKSEPDKAYQALRRAADQDPQLESTYAVAETAYILGVRATMKKDSDKAITMYGESLAVSYDYLFSPELSQQRNPYDPEFRGACDLYNGSLEGMLRHMAEEGFLHPGYTGSIQLKGRRMELTCSCSGRWDPEDIKEFHFTSDYEVQGLNNSYRSYGLGVPLIAVRRTDTDVSSPDEQYYPEGLTFPVTAFFRLHTAIPPDHDTERLLCNIEFHDPLDQTAIDVAGTRTPLETDISTPLAYYLNDPLVGTNTLATFALLDANFGKSFEGLYMLEPYDPEKIPVVMVHGLWSSPITWMEMFNDLRASADIRDQYQFWFYMYPTGQPFWVSAERMREDLMKVRKKVDPGHESEMLDQMVLIGHSMGGLVSRLQTIESGDRFWSLVSDRPFEELETDETTRENLRQVMFFSPDSSVKRVVTIGTPHRGSQFSNNTTQWLGRHLIVLPNMLTNQQAEVVKQNPDFFSDTELLTIDTSIDSLSPESPFLQAMLASKSAPWVKHHNILGIVESNSFDTWLGMRVVGEGDGVVPAESATFDNAVSEVVVPSPHQKIHQHPMAILEVQRILREHAAEIQAGIRRDHAVQPVGFNEEPNSPPEATDEARDFEKQDASIEQDAVSNTSSETTELPAPPSATPTAATPTAATPTAATPTAATPTAATPTAATPPEQGAPATQADQTDTPELPPQSSVDSEPETEDKGAGTASDKVNSQEMPSKRFSISDAPSAPMPQEPAPEPTPPPAEPPASASKRETVSDNSK